MKEKYNKIYEKFVSHLPPEDEMLPHLASIFTRDYIASKIK